MGDPVSIIGLAVSAVSTGLGVMSSIQEGKAAEKQAEFEARMREREARAATARGSRMAAEEDRQRRLALSRARVAGASSGSDRAFDLEGDLEREGQYRSLAAVWEGQNEAQGRYTQAAAARYDGAMAKRAGYIGAVGAGLSGAGSMFGKYGADLFDGGGIGSSGAGLSKSGGVSSKRRMY